MSVNDVMNHLARSWILLHYDDTAAFRAEYAPNWQLLPDLALDCFSYVAGRVAPLPFVGKVFTALTFVLLLGGASAVHYAIYRKLSVWPFSVALLLYSRPLLAGEVNYLCGVGIYLWVTALWIRLRERPRIWRVGVVSAGAAVIYFAHLFALGLLALTLAGYEIARWRRRAPFSEFARDCFATASPFILPAIVALALAPHSPGSFELEYRSILVRLAAFDAPFLYHPIVDVCGTLVFLGVFAWHCAHNAVRIDRGIAIALVLLFFAQLAIPNRLFTATSVDHRIPIAWMILAISAIDVVAVTRRAAGVFIAAILLLLVGRVAMVEARWKSDDLIYSQIQEGLSKLRPGVKVAVGYPANAFADSSRPAVAAFYIPSWEIARNGGYTQTVFTRPTQHPLVMRSEYQKLAESAPPAEVWAEFTQSEGLATKAPPLAHTPMAWADFDAFAILFPNSARNDTKDLLYFSPVIAIYSNRR